MSLRFFSLFVITCVVGTQFVNSDENVERITTKIKNCTMPYLMKSKKHNVTQANRILSEFFIKAQAKMYKKVENLYKDVRATGNIDTTINTDAIFYDFCYNELKDSNTTQLLKENVKIDKTIDETSKEMLYIIIENIINTLQQCLFGIKTALESHLVDICVNKRNPEESVEVKKVVDNCTNRFITIYKESEKKFEGTGKTDIEIDHIVTFIPAEISL